MLPGSDSAAKETGAKTEWDSYISLPTPNREL